jgi:NitT/TauT family transport system permease protein
MNIAIAFAILYLAESFATSSGLGFHIMNTWQQLSYNRMYAAILAMSAIGAFAFIGLAALENRLCRWKNNMKGVNTCF